VLLITSPELISLPVGHPRPGIGYIIFAATAEERA